MDDLIPLVNKLQDVFNSIGNDQIDLPQIVVVGSQSSGKSSVLENLVARDFLPRGSGIVTRRPLILQLVNVPEGEEEYGEFLHHPGKKFTDFSEIRKGIEEDTARIAGGNKGISRDPINLKVYSPHVVNLTLVDLPGLTKIPVGDQPTDIERQTKDLILHYISKPNSVILAVSPANVDIVNSESLKLAKEVDPEGRRTIGILTKLDLMDAGTNALDILTGRVYHLKLGFIGVVNRSQQDIITSKPITVSLNQERVFFQGHSAYKHISSRCGTTYLAKQLNHILLSHIRERLPDIKAKLNSLIGQTRQELQSFGEPPMEGIEHRGSLVLRLLTRYSADFNSAVDGTSPTITTRELCGGARIYYIFNSIFGAALDSIDPCADLSSQDIRTAIRNSTGPRPSLFVPEMAFDLLVKPQISRLEPPSVRCVELAYEELMKICNGVASRELQKYPKLYARVIEVVSTLLRERLDPTAAYVQSLISIQQAYINTNHPDFIHEVQSGPPSSSISSSTSRVNHGRSDGADARRRKRLGGSRGRQDHEGEGTTSAASASRHTKSADPAAGIGSTVSGAKEGGGESNFMDYFFGSGKSERFSTQSTIPPQATYAGSGIPGSGKDAPAGFLTPPTLAQTHLGGSESAAHVSGAGPLRFGDPMATAMMTEREEMETQLIRSLIGTYFGIVRKNIQDMVPKVVMHLLVDHVKEGLQTRLVASLYRESVFEELLQEDESITAERQRCQSMMEVYNRAFQIISEAV
ncbi:Dynamin central region-domain-containing protein [Piptocephalis cylindrospora]|uniref:Dynamin central region-domain-containing protein n=1 Tax=Piptocephalis cylindrospora TaxID=1907219 RepID=A0A4P9Y0S3_9FUNG|nr:Dynamin central region-domain-containing protein [Piptocephalis cylindrospora]|eukprot:RKP12082.1 Dynamin central region-domain-containing protein [Piptocephalis cylindrospora]